MKPRENPDEQSQTIPARDAMVELVNELAMCSAPVRALGALLANIDADEELFSGKDHQAGELRYGLKLLTEMCADRFDQAVRRADDKLRNTPEDTIHRAEKEVDRIRKADPVDALVSAEIHITALKDIRKQHGNRYPIDGLIARMMEARTDAERAGRMSFNGNGSTRWH